MSNNNADPTASGSYARAQFNELGPDAGIQGGNVAAHGMTDEPRWPIGRKNLQQRIQIGDVVSKPVAILRPLGPTETAPVRGNQRQVALEGVDQELEGVAGVEKPVQQEHHVLPAAPLQQVMAEAVGGEVEGTHG